MRGKLPSLFGRPTTQLDVAYANCSVAVAPFNDRELNFGHPLDRYMPAAAM